MGPHLVPCMWVLETCRVDRARSMHSGVFKGVGSLDTQSGYRSDEWADADAAYL